jgi:6-phosphogluconolactonase
MDDQTGALTHKGVVAECASPSFLAIAPDGRRVLAVNETGDYGGARTGSVSAFERDPASGGLRLINAVSSHGSYPCHIVLARSGAHVLLANYGSGTVVVAPVRPDGSLGDATCVVQHEGSSVNSERQEGPHAHSVNFDPSGRIALACDLGTDQIVPYRFETTSGTLVRTDAPAAKAAPGAGPRHLAFHPNGRLVYVINELDSTIAAYRYDAAQGGLRHIASSPTLPTSFVGPSTTAEVVVHPSGKWIYGSNRGHDSLAAFAINPASGALRPMGHVSTEGRTPRNFAVHPSGRLLIAANQDSNSIVAFAVDEATGMPRAAGHQAEVPQPVCVRFVPG